MDDSEFVNYILELQDKYNPAMQGILGQHRKDMSELDELMEDFRKRNGINNETPQTTTAQAGIMASPAVLPAVMHSNPAEADVTLERKISDNSSEERGKLPDTSEPTTNGHADSLVKRQASPTPEGLSNTK